MNEKLNLNEEVICGYTVTSDMKKIWQVELDLLEKFINMCNKHHLTYFFIGGSLIGAVRHDGFIPWDDDIDVGMFREDYEKLIKVASKEFEYPYFFQTPYNDDIYRGHAQLRNSNTSSILPNEIYLDHNQGIFIDIFPFDEYPVEKKDFYKQKKKKQMLERIMKNKYHQSYEGIKEKTVNLIYSSIIKIVGYKKLYAIFEKECSKYNYKGNGLVSNLSFTYGREKYAHKREYFTNLTTHKFHYLDVNIPVEYDKILTKQYGNYNEYVIGTSTHGNLYMSADKPYKEYLKELREKKMKKYKIGYTTGVFDMFHVGHLNILERAKEQCEYLIVGVSTDELVQSEKNKTPIIPYYERAKIVESIKFVDKVVPQVNKDKIEAYEKYKFDVMFVGDDWRGKEIFVKAEAELKKRGSTVVYFPYTTGTSSTILREKVLNYNK
jgi:lipopolysaccharide cholinephosphotransferase